MIRRSRLFFLVLAIVTIALGLGVHLRGGVLGVAARDVIGDALWAAMVAWLLGAAVPRVNAGIRGVAAAAICFCVEFSQLYHVPALDALRATPPGHLVLGSGFDPRDLLAYTTGIIAAVLIEGWGRTGARPTGR
jgi:hypothetical protein